MTDTSTDIIRASIGLLEQRLRRAHSYAVEARTAIHQANQNLAMGTLAIIEQDLAESDTLLKTCFLLHRSPRDEKASL